MIATPNDDVMKFIDPVDPREFHKTARMLREFFDERGFVEVPVQHRFSILAACEDPRTIATFSYLGQEWPLPQTGQMHLENELLKAPSAKGFYCMSYSFRAEPQPKLGRHNLAFPMFEFEMPGSHEALRALEQDLIVRLGIVNLHHEVAFAIYEEKAREYGVSEIGDEEERRLEKEYGNAVLLSYFPEHTSPFWNMRRSGDGTAEKTDCILFGIETIGSAERSTDPADMHHRFHTISNRMYAEILFSRFGYSRVMNELETFLSHAFFPRSGGGIGMTRLIRALKLAGTLV